MKESKINSKRFDLEDEKLAIWFFQDLGKREDISSCIIYTNKVQNCIKVEWTYYEKEEKELIIQVY